MKLQKIIFALCLLIAVAISIKSFREPDLWWQIRTGEWILEHNEVPGQDVFSFTMAGNEWINIKWGFEVLAALVVKIAGPESVFVLQSIVNCILAFFLYRLSVLYFRKQGIENVNENKAFLLTLVISFLLVMVGVEYRIIGRPEMSSHLLTIVFLYLLENNRQEPSKKIYLVIPLQLLWANFHEAFGIGIVIMIIYTFSAWIENIISGSKKSDAKKLTLVTLAAIASVIINPNGIKLLTRPFNILSQVYSNKYTTELLDFSAGEWWKKEAYIAIVLATISIFAILFSVRKEKNKVAGLVKIISIFNKPYLLVILAFVYLGLSAFRNLAFLSLICFPVSHYALFSKIKNKFSGSGFLQKYSGGIAVALLVIFYAGIVSNRYYEITNSRDRFGLEVLSVNNPAGAAEYILNHGLQDKACFSDYLTSSYLLWKLQPDFKTYIDLRDLDVFPAAFFNDFIRDINSPADFHNLDNIRHFDYAVVFRPQFNSLHSYLFNDSIFALTYVDAVAAVYEKTDSFSRGDIFSACRPVKTGAFATGLNKILNPFYKSYNYSAVENDYIAANYYMNVGRVELAKQRADQLALNSKTRYKAGEVMGQIYFRSAMQEPNDSAKSHLLRLAEESFLQSLRDNKNNAASFLGLGSVHYSEQNYSGAINDLKKCLDINNDNYDAHITIALSYNQLMGIATSKKEEYRQEVLKHYLKANSLNPGNPMVTANIGFLYFQMNDCDQALPFLSRVADGKGLEVKDSLAVHNCLRQCGK